MNVTEYAEKIRRENREHEIRDRNYRIDWYPDVKHRTRVYYMTSPMGFEVRQYVTEELIAEMGMEALEIHLVQYLMRELKEAESEAMETLMDGEPSDR